MVELHASVGPGEAAIRELAGRVDRLEVVQVGRDVRAAVDPEGHWLSVARRGELAALVAGTVFSVIDGQGRHRSVVGTEAASVVLERYREAGRDGLTRLNGEFVAIVADGDDRRTAVVTDRVGALPGFRARADDGGVRVTTNVQLAADDDALPLTFEPDFLAEYFVFQRTFGVRTPLSGVRKLPPGTVLVFDAAGQCVDERRYWTPRYEPSTRPYGEFVREFADRLSTVVDERLAAADRPGLLLSGGSDSRLLAHLVDGGAPAYHMNDGENEEARIARRIAEHTGLEFELLRRDAEYYLDVLAADAPYDNFTSWFYESHAVGFADRLAGQTLVTGLFCDILFRGYYLPMTHVTIPVWNRTLRLPRLDEVSAGALLEHRLERMAYGSVPSFLATDRSIEAVLDSEFRVTDSGVVDHGLRYPSIEPLYFSCYPLTNDYARDYFGTLRIGPRWSPFLDARLLDLQLEYPMEYMMERNVVNDAIERLDPSLLAIPHGESGVRLDSSRLRHELTIQVRSKLEDVREMLGLSDPDYATRGSWQDHEYLFGTDERFDEYLYSAEVRERLSELSVVDADGVYERYEAGGSYLEFYPLFTLLEMPVTKTVAGG